MHLNDIVLLLQDGLKMGKSLGNVLDPAALVKAYGADAVRFFFLKEVDFGQVGYSHASIGHLRHCMFHFCLGLQQGLGASVYKHESHGGEISQN